MADELIFTVEFHDELEGGLPDAIREQALDGLRKAARGVDDISHALVNIKKPAQKRDTAYLYEITVRLWMDGEDVVATETGEILDGTLRNVMDVIDRQVKKQRDRKRGI
ncbi:MAG: HPF/RaiA family ribosome-associated protein [bacterium]|nr:HPF/RaiA family ribosome-associated protein [bacterium]